MSGAVNRNAGSDRPGYAAVVIAGPTASGKSRLALTVAESLSGTIVNADSMQVYRDLRILTARPSPEDESRAPHALYGYVDASERYSVGRWRDAAVRAIERSRAEGRIPILVGGTGLYLRAISQGLAEIPDIPERVRTETARLHARVGGDRFHALLIERDPSAARLPAGDTQRMIRAWEVLEATGRSLTEWQAEPTAGASVAALTVLLMPPRAEIYNAINRRFCGMVAAGALDEVRALLARDLDPDLPAMKSVGAPELAEFLAGRCDQEAAIEAATRSSRRYAKRQFTWFRHQIEADLTIETQLSETSEGEIVHFIQDKGLTGNF